MCMCNCRYMYNIDHCRRIWLSMISMINAVGSKGDQRFAPLTELKMAYATCF